MDGINVVGAQNVQKSDQFDRNNQIDKEMFLKLLVAQLKHQDPLSPVDNNDFLINQFSFQLLKRFKT